MKRLHRSGLVGLVVLMTCGSLIASPLRAADSEEVVVPETSAAIWVAIDDQVAAMNALLESGELEDLHSHAFAVRDLTRGLLGRSTNLSRAAHKQVEASVGYVAILAKRLDESGDARDAASTKGNLEKLQRILAGIRIHYPKM